jgi:uncharacterized membrane protein YGL010W
MIAHKTADQWFAEYGESHQHPANELIHWICVPVIFVSVLGFVWSIPIPDGWLERAPWFNWALVAMAGAMVFYVRLSPALSAGMFFAMSLAYTALLMLELFAPWPLWQICLIAFVVAWIGQFIGHRVEGKKPSFFKDVLFLLVGPAWLLSFIYRRIGQRY